MPEKPRPRIGKLPPKYSFVLNPYAEHRFTRCPNCGQKTRQRKLPLVIHVDPKNPVSLNKTCRYCPDCDLLIAHQDEIETLLARLFAQLDPSLIGNDYLVLGTMERKAWREGLEEPWSIPDMLEHLHDFREVHGVRVQPDGWYPADMNPSELPVKEPAPLDTLWQSQRATKDRNAGMEPEPKTKRKRWRRRHK